MRLAAFKLRTNQIDVPFAQLRPYAIPRSPRSNAADAGLASPALEVGGKGAAKDGQGEGEEEGEGEVEEVETFRTPALPRQKRARDLVGAMESPSKRLTSSAIKGDAARSLLGLRAAQ